MLTPVMSAGRLFTAPQPLDTQLNARSRQDSIIMATDQKRSMASAKEVTQDFDKAKQEPLAASKDKESKPGITFAAQDSLPKLPIPNLEDTARRYLQALDPLQTAREHADSERAVTEFLNTDGPALQEKLKGYAEGKSSYIEQFCKYSLLFPI
jgi:carnitine O-acetyltransferase